MTAKSASSTRRESRVPSVIKGRVIKITKRAKPEEPVHQCAWAPDGEPCRFTDTIPGLARHIRNQHGVDRLEVGQIEWALRRNFDALARSQKARRA